MAPAASAPTANCVDFSRKFWRVAIAHLPQLARLYTSRALITTRFASIDLRGREFRLLPERHDQSGSATHAAQNSSGVADSARDDKTSENRRHCYGIISAAIQPGVQLLKSSPPIVPFTSSLVLQLRGPHLSTCPWWSIAISELVLSSTACAHSQLET